MLGKKVIRTSEASKNTINSLLGGVTGNIEIIFDNNLLMFSEIIAAMENNKNQGFTFKILPKQSGFIIGSNSSNDRGEILKVNNTL